MGSIAGASVWEQALYDHLRNHVEREVDTLQTYEHLAETTDSPAFAYVARLILEDERRHHQLLRDLAESIRIDASLSDEPTPIPDLGRFGADREEIIEATKRLLEIEREDNRELDRLAGELKDVKDTTLWELIVRMLQADNMKHRRILEFIGDRAKKAR